MSYRHICSRDYDFVSVFRTTVSHCLGAGLLRINVIWGSWAWTKSCSNSHSSRDLHFVSVFWTTVSHCTGSWTPQNKYWSEGLEPRQRAVVTATTTVPSSLSLSSKPLQLHNSDWRRMGMNINLMHLQTGWRVAVTSTVGGYIFVFWVLYTGNSGWRCIGIFSYLILFKKGEEMQSDLQEAGHLWWFDLCLAKKNVM